MSTFAITGCAGFIGSHLAEILVSDHKVAGIDCFDPYYPPEMKKQNLTGLVKNGNFRLHEVDIRDRKKLAKVFLETKPDAVIHLAARPGPRGSIIDPVLYTEMNVIGTVSLLEAMREAKVGRIVFASSSSVYGNNKTPFSESVPDLVPLSPYGTTKLICEYYLRTYHRLYNYRVTVLRFFTAFGPRQRPDMAIRKFTEMILRGDEIQIFGKPDMSRDYTYISDIIDGVVRAIRRDDAYETYNLGNSSPVPICDLIAMIEEAVGKKARVVYKPENSYEPRHTFANISKAQKNLGFYPRTQIREGIKRFYEWHKKNIQ